MSQTRSPPAGFIFHWTVSRVHDILFFQREAKNEIRGEVAGLWQIIFSEWSEKWNPRGFAGLRQIIFSEWSEKWNPRGGDSLKLYTKSFEQISIKRKIAIGAETYLVCVMKEWVKTQVKIYKRRWSEATSQMISNKNPYIPIATYWIRLSGMISKLSKNSDDFGHYIQSSKLLWPKAQERWGRSNTQQILSE